MTRQRRASLRSDGMGIEVLVEDGQLQRLLQENLHLKMEGKQSHLDSGGKRKPVIAI